MNHNYHHLSIETKTKIITMRNCSSATFSQIADQCGCSVTIRLLFGLIKIIFKIFH